MIDIFIRNLAGMKAAFHKISVFELESSSESTLVPLPCIRVFLEDPIKEFAIKKWLFPPKSMSGRIIKNRLWRNQKECSLEEFKELFDKKLNKGGCIGKILQKYNTTLDKEKIAHQYLQSIAFTHQTNIGIKHLNIFLDEFVDKLDDYKDKEKGNDNVKPVFKDLFTPIDLKNNYHMFDKNSLDSLVPDSQNDEVRKVMSSSVEKVDLYSQNEEILPQKSTLRTKKLLISSQHKAEQEQKKEIQQQLLKQQYSRQKVFEFQNLKEMVSLGYMDSNRTFSAKAANFYADLYVNQESRNGGGSKSGKTINSFSEQFLPFEVQGMSSDSVMRSVIMKAKVIERHFFEKVLPYLEDIAICTDGTTLNGLHYEQYFLLGYMNDSEELRIYVIDILSKKKSTGADVASSIDTYIHYLVKNCSSFNVKKFKYLLADHCSNNSGIINGAIANLRKKFPWIQFLGCKDHLCNLLIKVADTEITKLIIQIEIEKKSGVTIRNTFKHKFMDIMTRIVKFFTKPSNFADWKHFAGVDLKVPKTSLNRYLNGTSLCRFVVLNYNPIIKFLESHDYKGQKSKKKGLPKKWIQFLRNPIVIECLVICTYLHYNLRKTLGKFHQTTKTEDYHKLVGKLKDKFLTLARNPDAFVTRTIAFADHAKGDDLQLIDSRVKNMLSKLSNEGSNLLKVVMYKMIDKVNQYENLNISENRIHTNTRKIERSFGDIGKILSKNKRTRNILLMACQRIRFYVTLPIHHYITNDQYKTLRKKTRKSLENSKHRYKTVIRNMSTSKTKFTGRSSRLVSDSGYPINTRKRTRDHQDELENEKSKKRKVEVAELITSKATGKKTLFERQIEKITKSGSKRNTKSKLPNRIKLYTRTKFYLQVATP